MANGGLGWVPDWLVKLLAATLLAGGIGWAGYVNGTIADQGTTQAVQEKALENIQKAQDRMEAKLDAVLVRAAQGVK